MLSITVIGAGLIGPRHAGSIFASQKATLHSLVDPNPSSNSIAADFNVPFYQAVSALLDARPLPDAAVIATPNSTHAAVAIEFLEKGIPVLIEKPISDSIEKARTLLPYTHIAPILVGHHRRFNPYVTTALAVLPTIGIPIAVSGTWTLSKPTSYFLPPSEWRSDPATGGGPILINLVHDIDMLQFLFGPISRVQADAVKKQRDNAAEEGAVILLRFASGLVGTFVCADNVVSSASFESGTGENPIVPKAEGSGGEFLRVFGSLGTIRVGGAGVRVERQDSSEGDWTLPVVEERVAVDHSVVPFDAQMEHFIKVIQNQEKPRCTVEDGLRALLVCESIKEAIRSGQAVDIPT